jgi:hypothetical protein
MKLRKYYQGIVDRMLSELHSISDQMSHMGEKGRNNERLLVDFLNRHLPMKYSVTTGKVVSAEGMESNQVDVIIRDRFHTPPFITSPVWDLVPVETVYAVISVKTTLDRSELDNAIQNIQSVRRLNQVAAEEYENESRRKIPPSDLLRTPGLIFSLTSSWQSIDATDKAFRKLIEPIEDDFRPNGVIIADACFIRRHAYKTTTAVHNEDALLRFFVYLLHLLNRTHRGFVDLERYLL